MIFFWLFRPTVMVAPIDSSVPKYGSQIIDSCGNGICDKDETIFSCNSDCKKPSIKINSYKFESKKGEVPEGLEGHSLESVYIVNAEEGKVFLILDLTIDNKEGSVSLNVNPFFMKLKDSKGYIYQHSEATYKLENRFDGTLLDEGDVISGKIAFEIPKNENNFEFIIDDPLVTVSTYIKI